MSTKSPVNRGFVPNGGIGTLKEYGFNHSMQKLISKQNDSQDPYHMGSFDMFVASSNFEDHSTDFSMFFTNIFMLTTILRILESGWALNFAVDLFHRFCTADVKMIGYGMITLGGKHHPALFGTIPDKHGESKLMYQSAWQVLCHTLRRFVRDWRHCPNAACQQCKETKDSMHGPRAESWLRQAQFLRHGHLPVRAFLSDNSLGLLKMVKEDVDFMGVIFLICAAHLNGTVSILIFYSHFSETYLLTLSPPQLWGPRNKQNVSRTRMCSGSSRTFSTSSRV
jgi:hypothetical protein